MDFYAHLPEPHRSIHEEPLIRSVQLLQSIITNSGNHKSFIQHTREYRDFVYALEQLECVYRSVSSWNEDLSSLISHQSVDSSSESIVSHVKGIAPSVSFLQSVATDDVIRRIFSYLECFSILNTMTTCTRFHHLADAYAVERSRSMVARRQLSTPMALLKADEQIMIGNYGIGSVSNDERISTKGSVRPVPIPTLLLPKCIRVRDCGDSDYNGLYYCTGCNGNGYVFTKPIFPIQKRPVVNNADFAQCIDELDTAECHGAEPGQPLRCIIAKRFSQETLLWYMSKEELSSASLVEQSFSFWANLMAIGDTDKSDLLCYPSFSSPLGSRRDVIGWGTLPGTATLSPPIVELIE